MGVGAGADNDAPREGGEQGGIAPALGDAKGDVLLPVRNRKKNHVELKFSFILEILILKGLNRIR